MENNNQIKNYLEQLKTQKNLPAKKVNFPLFDRNLNIEKFLEIFKLQYTMLYKKEFVEINESLELVSTLFDYFTKSKDFLTSPLLYRIKDVDISLDKGLIIVGGFGVGKTSILKTFTEIIKNISLNFNQYPIRMHNTQDIVEEFECGGSDSRIDVIDKYSKSYRIFDDVKNERKASKYGIIDLLKEIIYKRCETRNFRTIIICNYDPENPDDMNQAIESFYRYEGQVYDRLYEAFNFIEIKGKSMRK
jgi:DNA replication protein DnaC